MARSNLVLALLFVLVLSVGFAEGDDLLKLFRSNVRKSLPKETYNKVYATNVDDIDQFLKAIQISTDRFGAVLGAQIDDSLQKQLVDEGKAVGLTGVSPSFLFKVYVDTLGKFLKVNGKLNSNNVKDVAQKVVNELNKAAKSLKRTNFLSTFPALLATNARVLKSFGLTSKEKANQFIQILIKETDKDNIILN